MINYKKNRETKKDVRPFRACAETDGLTTTPEPPINETNNRVECAVWSDERSDNVRNFQGRSFICYKGNRCFILFTILTGFDRLLFIHHRVLFTC